MTQFTGRFDLEERTAQFGEQIIRFCRSMKGDPLTASILRQLIRSGTSIGANYTEANGASSRKDFRNKIYLCKKEAQETKHWLRMSATCFPSCKNEIKILWKEVQELTMIFQKIISSLESTNK